MPTVSGQPRVSFAAPRCRTYAPERQRGGCRGASGSSPFRPVSAAADERLAAGFRFGRMPWQPHTSRRHQEGGVR